MVEIGDVVTYVDTHGAQHKALVVAVWKGEYPSSTEPGINLVYVSSDSMEQDPFGRQMKRENSVVHKKGQPAPAHYWV